MRNGTFCARLRVNIKQLDRAYPTENPKLGPVNYDDLTGDIFSVLKLTCVNNMVHPSVEWFLC